MHNLNTMVDLTDAGSPFQQSIPNFAFYVPAVVVFGLAGKCIQGEGREVEQHRIASCMR